jgi:hypothetical protein
MALNKIKKVSNLFRLLLRKIKKTREIKWSLFVL